MKDLVAKNGAPTELARIIENHKKSLEELTAAQNRHLEEELKQLLSAHDDVYNLEREQLQKMLVAEMAENERLADVNKARFNFQQLESQNSWQGRIAEIIVQAANSPFSMASLPFKLNKLRRESKLRKIPKSLGGESFSAVLSAYDDDGFEGVKTLLDKKSLAPAVKADAYTALSRYLQNTEAKRAGDAAYLAYKEDPRAYRRKWLAFRLYEAGDACGADTLLESLRESMDFSESEARVAATIARIAQTERQLTANMKFANRFKGRSEPSDTRSASRSLPLVEESRRSQEPSEGPGPRVACVMDDFTFFSYALEGCFFPLTPDRAVEELESFRPDLLFIESAWRGKDDLWRGKVNFLADELRGVLAWCREHQVPTAFWNKEDPIHFQTFLTAAQEFDVVFTTDIDCIARYKAALGHDRVYLLPFACQPQLNNPIERYARKDAFCFAGAYYVRYPERTADLKRYAVELTQFKPLEIYDRNFGQDDLNYKFPEEYDQFIVGTLPFHEMDKAYKGYQYAINLNSIKQSQTMFARRVYEILGSNTVTVSNFSRGLRLFFGDLVITSDSGDEIVRRLRNLDEEAGQKLRLAGLRKVMNEHCYAHRLQYVLSKVLGRPRKSLLPTMAVVAAAGSEAEYGRILSSFRAQNYRDKQLLVLLGKGVDRERLSAARDGERIGFMELSKRNAKQKVHSLIQEGQWLALMVPEDYYGPNYLLDLALATQYSEARLLGKARRYQWTADEISLLEPDSLYRPADRLPARCSAIHSSAVPRELTVSSLFMGGDYLQKQWILPGLALDAFNYCRQGQLATNLDEVRSRVNDMELEVGLPLDEILGAAENIAPAKVESDDLPTWDGQFFHKLFGEVKSAGISFENEAEGLSVRSALPDGKHEYIYAEENFPIEALAPEAVIKNFAEVTPGLNIQYVFIYFDKKKKRLSHVIHASNNNYTDQAPDGAAFIRFGLRIYGGGQAVIKRLVWGHCDLTPDYLFSRNDILLLTNHYPSYDDLYRNGFVHSRVKAYKKHGTGVDVFRFRTRDGLSYHEFQDIDVITGGAASLRKLLDMGRYRHILVHFLSSEMWAVLQHYPDVKITVWVHGAEIQPWYRRDFNYENEQARECAKVVSDERMAFWRGLLSPMPPDNLHLVFVSHYFAEEVMEDLGFRLPENAFSIIHNPIDASLFTYVPKPVEQRKCVLSIRPYSSRKYANDLSVQAILHLSTRPCFQDMAFRMIGDGELFSETLQPLEGFPNVTIERRFLTQDEIASLHKQYGVVLSPTRMDAQGVSRDEAMSSGLVPVTTAITAIPEFVDSGCGFLAEPEDALGLANAIKQLYDEPDLFTQLSLAAAERVRKQTSQDIIIPKEIALMGRK